MQPRESCSTRLITPPNHRTDRRPGTLSVILSPPVGQLVNWVSKLGDEPDGKGHRSGLHNNLKTGKLLHTLPDPLPNVGVGGDSFGISVSISGNLAIVGAPNEERDGILAGDAYLFNVATVRTSWISRTPRLIRHNTDPPF